ncbi:zinc-dependent alcohol dehydrogenase [Natronoglomus mannanivorans]|uniref:Alcohol dehydrogenase catalytic domain-containing protein n=1 Tax=Natronoglomus mannanivorans TaxID=2979990 RepID=A0AAP3E2X2_9EURY|nr:alcohol dehydrogenase catalytic domain-containing protein [Halobacteria archaeon AArc-xg1-1]
MRAARYHGEDDLRVEDVPEPTVAADEVLVDLRAASLCGSDVNYLTGKTDPATDPITLGHEGAGVVEAVGESVESVSVGDRVAIHYIRSCGTCRPCSSGHDNQCRNRESIGHHVDGTFAEYIAVPERALVALPDGIPFGVGSIAGCAVATGYHAVQRAEVSPGDAVVVFGAGGVGLHAVLWADHVGAATVIAVDLDDHQLEAAAEYGADVTLNPERDDVQERILAETDGWAADSAIECSGSAVAMEGAIEAIDGQNGYESGTVVSVGIQTEDIAVGFGDVREGQLRVVGDHLRSELQDIVRLLETEAVDVSPSITHEITLEEIQDGVDLVLEGDERVGRVVIDTTGA